MLKIFINPKKCVMLGVCGKSENTTIEIDHKDGQQTRKNQQGARYGKSKNSW
ncbi:hypothetical protein ACN31W_000356 [Campylobacter upsaliensis]